jgi:fibronectin-binding autotransporter adhesin
VLDINDASVTALCAKPHSPPMLKKSYLSAKLLALLGASVAPLTAVDFTVTTIADAGAGSLRQAIIDANATVAEDTILFSNSTVGGAVNFHDATPDIIDLASQLPTFSQPTTVTGPGADKLSIRRPVTAVSFRLVEFNAPNMSMAMSGLTLTGGSAQNDGGGAIYNKSNLTLSYCTLLNNKAYFGGAILNETNGRLTVENSTFSSNTADGGSAAGQSGGGGGAIYCRFQVFAINCTFSGNTSLSLSNGGGAVLNASSFSALYSTFTGNSSVSSGGGIYNPFGTLSVLNSIIAGNTAPSGPDVSGALTSSGPNFFGNPSGASGVLATDKTFASTGVSLTQLIGPLQFNGGPTKTHGLVFGSPAIDGGASVLFGISTDQRGFGPRINGAGIDIGAYESGIIAPGSPVPVVTTTADTINDFDGQTSLREAVNYANTLSGPQVITFSNNSNGGAVNFHDTSPDVISLNLPLPALIGQLTLTGPGADKLTIRRNAASAFNFRVIDVSSSATCNLTGLTFSGGMDVQGGGIRNAGTLVVNACAISGNEAIFSTSGGGGGIYDSGTLTMSNSTISGNSATAADGGGIFKSGGGLLTMTQCTISGNSANTNGGGVFIESSTSNWSHCTISANSSTFNGGGVFNNATTLTLNNSIVAGNTSGVGADISGSVSATSTNFIGTNAGVTTGAGGLAAFKTFGNTATTLSQLIGPLANNGGPVKTHALVTGGPAINMGNYTTAGIISDQRGYGPRVQGPAVDIGAYEFGALAAVVEMPSLIVTTTDDSVFPDGKISLREAILQANTGTTKQSIFFSNNTANGSVNFHDGTSRVMDLFSQLPALSGQIFLVGPGAAKLTLRRPPSATANYRIMEVASLGDVTISGLTISGGQTLISGGAILSNGMLTVNSCVISNNTSSSGFGGGIANAGILAVNQSRLTGNSGIRGGGLDNFGTATLSLTFVDNNTALEEGAGIRNLGTLTLLQSQVSFNTVTARGGGIYSGNFSTLTLYSSTVGNNTSSTQGAGGLLIGFAVQATIANSTISENLALAAGGGGGIENYGNLTLSNCTLAENFASGNGGGILSGSGGTLAVKNSIVAGNFSTTNNGPEIFGILTSNGSNYIGIPAGATGVSPSDQTFDVNQVNNVLEILDPLSSNGGPTDTNALKAALGFGNANDIPADLFDFDDDEDFSEPIPFDQRGLARVIGGTVDVGAYEFDSTMPLQSWRAIHGLATDGSQDLANPSGDGVKNLLKYAFNIAPNAGNLNTPNLSILPITGSAGLPNISRNASGQLVIIFIRRNASTNPQISYIPETSIDLVTFAPLNLVGASIVPIDSTWERVTVIDPAVTAKRFGRVRVMKL